MEFLRIPIIPKSSKEIPIISMEIPKIPMFWEALDAQPGRPCARGHPKPGAKARCWPPAPGPQSLAPPRKIGIFGILDVFLEFDWNSTKTSSITKITINYNQIPKNNQTNQHAQNQMLKGEFVEGYRD